MDLTEPRTQELKSSEDHTMFYAAEHAGIGTAVLTATDDVFHVERCSAAMECALGTMTRGAGSSPAPHERLKHLVAGLTFREDRDGRAVCRTSLPGGLLFTSVRANTPTGTQYTCFMTPSDSRMRHAESIARLAAGMAHEINNPLAYLLLNLGVLRRELKAALGEAERTRADGMMRAMREGADRIAAIVRDLRVVAPGHDRTQSAVRVTRAMEYAESVHLARIETQGVLVSAPLTNDAEIWGSEAAVCQVFSVLLGAAISATPKADDGHTRTVHITVTEDNDNVCIEVADHGPPLDPRTVSRLFEPFFPRHDHHEDTGLGLFTARTLAEQMSGSLTACSNSDRGTVMRLLLPSARAMRRAAGPGEGPLPQATASTSAARFKATTDVMDADGPVGESGEHLTDRGRQHLVPADDRNKTRRGDA